MHTRSKKGLRPLFFKPATEKSYTVWPLVLVVAQFLLIFLLIGLVWHTAKGWQFWIAALGCVLPAFWAVYTMRVIAWGVMPQPKENAYLVAKGPYRWVRHPMYTSVVLLAWVAAIQTASWVAWIACMSLCVVIAIKIRIEEHFLLQRYEGYLAYCATTGMLFPKLTFLRSKQ